MKVRYYIGYILDDHNLFSESLAKILEAYLPFESIFVFSHPKDLIYHLMTVKTEKQKFLFLDYYIGDKTLPTVLSEIIRVAKNYKIIVISSITNAILLRDILYHKIDGIIHKSDHSSDIIKCILEVTEQKVFFSPYIHQILSTAEIISINPFSARETELLSYFIRGLTLKETAKAINLSYYTVATHRKKMFRKIKCKNISELLAFARKLEIV